MFCISVLLHPAEENSRMSARLGALAATLLETFSVCQKTADVL
jgi:hypothetical protein